jgi:hypothetical protein
MKQKFKKTVEIENIEAIIEQLGDSLSENKEKLKAACQVEFDKQFGVVIGKTILIHKNKDYVYMGFRSSLFIL